MKIAMIGQKGIPALQGGVEKHVQELALRLVEDNHEVVAYTRPWYTLKRLDNHKGVRLVSLPSIKAKHFDAITHTALAIFHAAWKEKADIIHIHAVGPALLTWLARLLRPQSKVVVTFHCLDRQHQKWGILARMMLWLGEWSAMKFAHEVIAVSRTLQQYSYEVYKRSVRYIPNGVSHVQQQPVSVIKEQFGLDKDSYIVMVARLVRHKGVHHLIKAYNQLDTDKKLVIVGGSAFTDDYVKEIHSMAVNNPDIIFTGFQSGRVLEELFSNAYCYVLPSESEGLPIALLEAAAYGLPLIASDIPANLEIVQHCGISFRNTDVDSLKHALRTVLDDPEYADVLGKQARKHVHKYYQWDDIAKQTIQLYGDCLSESPVIHKTLAKA